MRDAIISFGGVPGVNIALCETVQVPTVLSSKIEGIIQLSNVEYKEEGLLVLRAYGIGGGKLIPTDKLHCPSPSDLPTLTGVTRSHSSAFTSVKERPIKASVRDPDPPMHFEEEDSNVAIFSCSEEGCVKTFERYSSMQRHLDCGKRQRALERHTLLDSKQRQVELFTFRLVKQNLFERSNWVNLHGAARLRNSFCHEKNYITFKNSSCTC